MGLILWIDQNTFATALLEKAFKRKNLNFYSLTKALDIAYLVTDLKPEAIVLDTLTAKADLVSFQTHYLENDCLKDARYILIGKDDGLEFIEKKIGTLERPFDPFEIPLILQKMLGELS